jgi:pimeloyl-ACP methyl ester carboxylesterase
LVLICTTVSIGCGRGLEKTTGPVDPSPPHEGFATVGGVRLHYLDWGGTGPAFVLIHGFCVSPYTFYGLAPALADDFRVIAYARRSHGQSDIPAGGYDNSTLVEDLRGLLDSLGIEKAHLLGWSMGGNEITDFAIRYPDRVGRLVYLEAGYDFSDPDFLEAYGSPPVDFPPDDASLRSLDAYREWWHAVMASGMPWTDDLETCFRDTVRIMPDGTIETRPSGDIFEQCMTSLADTPRDYAGVGVPALAL